MEKILASILLLAALLVSPMQGLAAEAPLLISHQLTSFAEGSTGVTLYFSLHLQNPGDGTLTGLDLVFIPLPPYQPTKGSVYVASLGPHQGADVQLVLEAPARARLADLARGPLLFAGKCLNQQGVEVQFPATSKLSGKGGAQ